MHILLFTLTVGAREGAMIDDCSMSSLGTGSTLEQGVRLGLHPSFWHCTPSLA